MSAPTIDTTDWGPTEDLIKKTLRSEYTRGWNDGLRQAVLLLETNEALTGQSAKPLKLAIEALKRSVPSERPERGK